MIDQVHNNFTSWGKEHDYMNNIIRYKNDGTMTISPYSVCLFGYQKHLFQYKQQFLFPILVLPQCIPRCLRYALPVNIMQILTEVIYATPL